jgi:DNA-binding NarL/FixJ family response regulator
MRVRILIVDDNPKFAASISTFLSRRPTVEVLGCAQTGAEALERARRDAPDLVLVDLVMPSMNGLDLTKQLRALPRPPRVVVLTLAEHPSYVAHARAVGADALLSKYEVTTRLMPIIARLFGARARAETEEDEHDDASS